MVDRCEPIYRTMRGNIQRTRNYGFAWRTRESFQVDAEHWNVCISNDKKTLKVPSMNDLAFDFLKESKGLVGNMGSFKGTTESME